MIRLFRRHRTTCVQTSETYRRCACPIYAEGKVGTEKLPKTALNLTSWEAAQKWVRERETAGTLTIKHEINIEDALKKFIADGEARPLGEATLRKYRLLQKRLNSFGQSNGLLRCSDFTTDTLRDFRGTWNLGARTSAKMLERLRSFFRFCQENGWIEKNPATPIKVSKVASNPTLPFSSKQVLALFQTIRGIRPRRTILRFTSATAPFVGYMELPGVTPLHLPFDFSMNTKSPGCIRSADSVTRRTSIAA